MRTARLGWIIAGAILSLFFVALLAGAGVVLWAHSQRDADGYLSARSGPMFTSGFAFTSPGITLAAARDDWVPSGMVDAVRVEATGTAPGSLFVGIARTADADRYLADVSHEQVRDINAGHLMMRTGGTQRRAVPGTRVPSPPTAQPFWAAQASGPGRQTVSWRVQPGKWTAVVMNADGSAQVSASITVGVKTGALLPIGLGLLGAGIIMAAGCGVLFWVGLRRRSGAADDAPPATVSAPPGSYPLRLDGHLDPHTSRWLWLVKWLLIIPHVIVLGLLWVAVSVLTLAAGVAILFTGRYPRSIFGFTVGVLRWSWRVSFYSIGAFGTDRYPPFTLAPDPTFPAELDVDYPERVSRPLVLVKWLLALPHLVIVGVLAGGLGQVWSAHFAGGVIAVLALLGAITLAVTGRYSQPIFDIVVGLNRWVYRVAAYVLLLRDEFPPFRLDAGGPDPGSWLRLTGEPSNTPPARPTVPAS
jgi:hypothetical protein